MAIQERIFKIAKEQSLGDFDGSNRGNGNDYHAPIGKTGTTVFRELLQFDHDWSGMYRVLSIKLRLRRDNQTHLAFGGSPRLRIRRVTAAWQENGGAENSWSTGANTHWGNQPAVASGTLESDVLGTSEDGWSVVDITDIYDSYIPTTVLKVNRASGGGETNHGIRVGDNSLEPILIYIPIDHRAYIITKK